MNSNIDPFIAPRLEKSVLFSIYLLILENTSASSDTALAKVKRDLSALLQGMNYNEMAYKEIFRRITYVSWATQHCIKWPRRVPGKRNAVFPFLHEFESWNKTCEISLIIFHSYRQNAKRTPMTTNNSTLHRVTAIARKGTQFRKSRSLLDIP